LRLLIQPILGIARGREAEQVTTAEQPVLMLFAHIPMGKTTAEDALHIAFEHCWRRTEPNRINQHENSGTGQSAEFLHYVLMNAKIWFAGPFFVLKHGVEPKTIKVSQADLVADPFDGPTIGLRNQAVETIAPGVAEDHGVLWDVRHEISPSASPTDPLTG
jgi:hypothetical protein